MAIHSRLIHNTVTAPTAMRSPAWLGREIFHSVDPTISDYRHDAGPSASVVVTRIMSVLEESNQA